MKRPKMSASLMQWEKYREFKREQSKKKALIKSISKMK
tara:strand:- start:479 stop:592 length:114 start_codon:yes stop_codon:yes gene_type:complete